MLRPYGTGLVLLLCAMAAAGLAQRTHVAPVAGAVGQAAPYLARVKTTVLALPWPEDAQALANLGAGLNAAPFDIDTERVAAVYGDSGMRAFVGEAQPRYESVGAALQRETPAVRAGNGAKVNPLWDRVLAKALVLEVGTADSEWPMWMPPGARPGDYHLEAAGAWVANKRAVGYQSIVFPLRVTNRSDVALTAIDGAAAFFFAAQQQPHTVRPSAAIRCPIALDALAPGASAVIGCAFVYPSFAKNAVELGLGLVAAARAGELTAQIEAARAPQSPRWMLPPPTQPLLQAELQRYQALQGLDRRQAMQARALEEGLFELVVALGLVLVGYAVAGVLDAYELRPGWRSGVGGLGLGAVAVVVAAGVWGGGGYGPLAIAIVGFYALGAVLVGLVLGLWLAPRHWPGSVVASS